MGVTNDSFDRDRGKLNVRNNVLERVEAVKATGYADKIIIEDYVGQKIDDIQKYKRDSKDSAVLENIIDNKVFDLYGLSEDERAFTLNSHTKR